MCSTLQNVALVFKRDEIGIVAIPLVAFRLEQLLIETGLLAVSSRRGS